MARAQSVLTLLFCFCLVLITNVQAQTNNSTCENCGLRQYLEDLKLEFNKLSCIKGKLENALVILNNTNISSTRQKQLDKVKFGLQSIETEMNVIGNVCSRFEGSNCDSGCKTGWSGALCENNCSTSTNYKNYYPLNGNFNDYAPNSSNNLGSTSTFASNFNGKKCVYCHGNQALSSSTITIGAGTSISLWLNRISGNGIPFNFDGGNFYIEFNVAGSGTDVGFKFYMSGSSANIESNAFPANTWKHITLVFKSGGIDLFMDGNLSKTTTVSMITTTQKLALCTYTPSSSYNFDGYIADFKIFPTALTSTEVKNLFSCA